MATCVCCFCFASQTVPLPIDPPPPGLVAEDADPAKDNETRADGASDDFVVVARDLDAVPEFPVRSRDVENHRQKLDYADDERADDCQRRQHDGIVQERQWIFDPRCTVVLLLPLPLLSLVVLGWRCCPFDVVVGQNMYMTNTFKTMSRFTTMFRSTSKSVRIRGRRRDDCVIEVLLCLQVILLIVPTPTHAHGRNVQAHHQGPVNGVDETHADGKQDGKDQNEPHIRALGALDAADAQQGYLGARIEPQPEEYAEWVHFPGPVDELERLLERTEKAAAAFDFPCLALILVRLQTDDLADLHK